MLVLSAVTHRVFPARARVGLCAGAVSAAGHQPMMNRESRNGRRGRKGECRESRPNREKVSGNPTAGVYGRDGKFLPPLGEFPGGVGARGFNFCRAPASPACDSSLAAPAVSAATTGWSAWNTRASLILIRIQIELYNPLPSGQSMNAFVIGFKGCQSVAQLILDGIQAVEDPVVERLFPEFAP